MKAKRIQKDDLLRDGTVHYGVASDGTVWENGKPLTAAKPSEPTKPAALDVVHPKPKPTNAAVKITERKLPPGVTGLQRSILANVLAADGEIPTTKVEESGLTGLQRAIAGNIKAQKK